MSKISIHRELPTSTAWNPTPPVARSASEVVRGRLQVSASPDRLSIFLRACTFLHCSKTGYGRRTEPTSILWPHIIHSTFHLASTWTLVALVLR